MDVLAQATTCRFDDFLLDLDARVLFRLNESGKPAPVSLGSRAFGILCVLIERQGEFVSKHEIMNSVWPDAAVEESNLTVQMSALRRALDVGRGSGSCIQTIANRGYCFLPKVDRSVAYGGTLSTDRSDPRSPDLAASLPHSDAVSKGSPGLTDQIAPPRRRPRFSRWAIAPGLFVLISIVSLLWYTSRPPTGITERPRLSVVVMPFENLSGDPADNYLADSVTGEVTTDLSRVPVMFVIARSTAESYRGQLDDPIAIGQQFGVRYLIKGSVRKVGDTIRVNAQLIATETGQHLWADRFEEKLNEPSSGQEEIVVRIGRTLSVALLDIESARSKRERPTEPDALDLILRARAIGMHPMGPRENAARLALFEQALRLDPTSVLAMMGIATVLIESGRKGDELDRAAKLVAEAAAINPNHQLVLSNTAYLLAAQHRFPEAILAYERVLDHYPNFTAGYANIGRYLIFAGRLEDAIRMIEMSIRRDPRNPYLSHRASDIGFALLLLGRYEEAIGWTQRAIAAGPSPAAAREAQNYLRIAAAQALLGQLDEAHRALAEANRIWPYDTVRSRGFEILFNPVYAAQAERFQAALRLAGHRDHADEDADFGVVSDDKLHQEDYHLAGQTPTTAPGAQTIHTAELWRLITEQNPLVIDSLEYFCGRSIPGAVGLRFAGWGSSVADGMQDRLRRKMQELTRGDFDRPIVAVGWNAERFDGRNLALRLVALGYTQVYWYRGGREAWEVKGLPEVTLTGTDW